MNNFSRNLKHNMYKLKRRYKNNGFDLWWHSFTGTHTITGEEKNFFIEYYILNPRLTPSKVTFGQREDNKLYNRHPCYALIKAGAWGENAKQIHNFYPTDELVIHPKQLNIQIGSCKISEVAISGSVHVDPQEALFHPECLTSAGSMSWDLKVYKKISGVQKKKSSFFTQTELFWHGQGIQTEYDGRITFDGEDYLVSSENSNGYADKKWGTSFPNPYLAIYANNISCLFSGKKLLNSSLTIFNGISKLLGVPRKEKIMLLLNIEGKKYEYNLSTHMRQSKISYTITENDDENLLHWIITAEDKKILIDVHVYCKKNEMIKLLHESPDGQLQYPDLLCGGTGWGHLKLYKQKGKVIETIENLSFEHVGCSYKAANQNLNIKP